MNDFVFEQVIQQIVELLENKNYHKLKPLLDEINATDLAQILTDLPEESLPIVFRLLSKDLASETFVEMDSDSQELLIRSFSDKELKEIINDLFVDDTVDILEEMPANVVRRILSQTDAKTRKEINELLKYPEDSAGAIMTTEYVWLKKSMTVEEAFASIRKLAVDKETVYTCYVIDTGRHLEGVVSVKQLLLSSYQTRIEDIMETNIISIHTLDDKETAARSFDKYNYLAMPVVDKENRLVGIITFDDAMDVIREENTEDISKMAATLPTDTPYLKTGVFKLVLSRMPWLLLLMISATFTGLVISNNEDVLNASTYGIILTACIPMLMDTGGNAGSQASVTVIRSLALDEVRFKDIFVVLWKEIRVAVILGFILAIACFAKLMLIDRLYQVENGYMIASVVCLTIFLTVSIAKMIGCSLPLFAKKLKLDPAVVSSPFITTIVDLLSLLIFCNVAIALLG